MLSSFPYFAMFTPIAIAAFLNIRLAFPWLATFIILFSSFRSGIGYDYNAYLDIINYKNLTQLEPASELIINTARLFHNEQLFFLISSAIITLPLFRFFISKTTNPNLALLVFFSFPYFYLSSLTIVRQWMAISVFIYLFSLTHKKNVLVNILMVLACCFFHYSAIIALPLVLLRKHLNKPLGLSVYVTVLIFPLTLLCFYPALHSAISFISPKYVLYLNSGDNGLNILLLYSILIVSFTLFAIHTNHPVQWLYLNASIIGLAMLALLSNFSEASMRASYYYLAFFIPSLVNFIESTSTPQRYRVIIIATGFLLLSIQLYLGYVNKDVNPYFPVKFRLSS